MGDRKEEDLYRNFSRKDLQGLCKKYGLPANKSNSEMATSLILYLEKKNLCSKVIWEGTRSDLFASGTTELQTVVRMNSTDDQRKDRGRMASRTGSGINLRHDYRDAQPNDLQNCKDSATSDKASFDLGNSSQLHRESNSGAGIPENTFSSVVSSPVVAPSPTFTFDVRSEDGIQLYVDLNSTPSDWIESLTSGVHISHDVLKPKSQSFHEDIGLLCCSKQKNGSSNIDPSKGTDNGQLQDGSYPTTILTENLEQTDEFDEREGSMFSPAPGLKALSNAIHSLENLKEKQGSLSSRLDCGTEGQIPGVKSGRREEILVADSDVNAEFQTRTFCNFTGNSVPFDPKCSRISEHQRASVGNGKYKNQPLHQTFCSQDPVPKCCELPTTVCMERQASTSANMMSQAIEYSPTGVGRCLNVLEQLKNTEVPLVRSVQTTSWDELQMSPAQAVGQSTCVSPVLNSLSLDHADDGSKGDTERSRTTFFRKSGRQIRESKKHSAENAGFVRRLEAGNEIDELQKKDAALFPCCNDGSLDLAVPKQNGADYRISNKSNELQEDIFRSPSTANVENLGKSDTGNGREGSECLNLNNLIEKTWKEPSDSESTRERKRKRNRNSVDHQSINAEAKNLRSSKQSAGDVHSKRRRSSRLFPK